jgi:hypothetical protein
MFLGRYDYEGEPDSLLAAYDRFMAGADPAELSFHVCIRRDGGITVYDTCPSAAVFAAFSSNPQVLAAMRAAGLPAPAVTPLGNVHRALASTDHVV